MKKSILLLFLLMPLLILAQVGIGTTNPQETLHVNGTMRVSNTSSSVTSTKVSGFDANGTVRQVSVGSNLVLANNVLSAKYKHSFGTITLPEGKSNNVDLFINPNISNQVNVDHTIIKIICSDGDKDIEISGFKAGYDGQTVWLYPLNGKLALANNTDSLPGNRIEGNDKPAAKRYEMINIVYDLSRARWIIMQNHS